MVNKAKPLSDNIKALIIFICFMAALGCAGNGDYEYAKSKEVKQIKAQEKMCK